MLLMLYLYYTRLLTQKTQLLVSVSILKLATRDGIVYGARGGT